MSVHIFDEIIDIDKIDNEIIETYIENNYSYSLSLKIIPEKYKTYDICLKAVRLNILLFYYVPQHLKTSKLYLVGIKNYENDCGYKLPIYYKYLNNEIRLEIVKKDGSKIKFFDRENITKEIVNEAVKKGKGGISNVLNYCLTHQIDYETFLTAIENERRMSPFSARQIINMIPIKLLDHYSCEKLVEKIPEIFFYIPIKYINKKLFLKSIDGFNNIIYNIENDHIKVCQKHPLLNFVNIYFYCDEYLKFLTYDICLNKVFGTPGGKYFSLKYLPENYKTKEVCIKALIDNIIDNINFVPKNIFKEVLSSACKENPNIIKKGIENCLGFKNISEIFIENIYEKPKVSINIVKYFCNPRNLKDFYKLFIDNREYLQEEIEYIYKKFKNEHETKMLNDIINIFNIIIKKKKGDEEDDKLYIIDGFIPGGIGTILEKLLGNQYIYINDTTPKQLQKILNSLNIDKIKILNVKSFKKQKIDIISKYNNIIPIISHNTDINLINMDYTELTKMVNVVNGKYYTNPYYNRTYVSNNNIIDYDEEEEYYYFSYHFIVNYNKIDFLLLYFECYRKMEENNFKLSIDNFEIPNKKYLKKARYIPVFLNEIIIYDDENNKINIKTLTKKLKTYICKFDKTLSNKITVKKVI